MNIISGKTEFNINESTVVTVGKFDGLHNGHKLILDRMSEYRTMGLKTCVLTFDMPPAKMGMGGDVDVLHTMSEKEQVFRRYGIDYLIEFPFYEKTASISAQNFIEEYIVDKMNAKAVVVGYDCTFGHRAKGNAAMLKDYGPLCDYQVEILDKLMDGDREISSTYIRELVREGNVKRADELCFRPFFINGKFKRGTSSFSSGILIYSVDIPVGKIIPPDGLYYSKVLFEDAFYPALTQVTAEPRELQTYIYGGVKGIARGEVSIALFEKKRDIYDIEDIKEKSEVFRQDIFDGQKWHKEHPRN